MYAATVLIVFLSVQNDRIAPIRPVRAYIRLESCQKRGIVQPKGAEYSIRALIRGISRLLFRLFGVGHRGFDLRPLVEGARLQKEMLLIEEMFLKEGMPLQEEVRL